MGKVMWKQSVENQDSIFIKNPHILLSLTTTTKCCTSYPAHLHRWAAVTVAFWSQLRASSFCRQNTLLGFPLTDGEKTLLGFTWLWRLSLLPVEQKQMYYNIRASRFLKDTKLWTVLNKGICAAPKVYSNSLVYTSSQYIMLPRGIFTEKEVF